ncbi:MAG TPA: DUF2892 domain-containing protein [Propionibacteriaceae bacterium]|nr:DUF2892 domain-containing protein [Propionibacteriaceae bacterium]
MTKNVSDTDKIVRLGLSVVAFIGALLAGFGSVVGVILLIIALLAAVTAVIGFCPIYRMLGISTTPSKP